MRVISVGLRLGIVVMMALTRNAWSAAQDTSGGTSSRVIVGHPFSAIKYSHRVKVLPNGERQFLRNERYPTRIARDAEGRLMMEKQRRNDNLPPECNRLDLLVPPPCPAWGVVVLNPVARTVTHWGLGEHMSPGSVEYPLTPPRLEEAVDSTASMPTLGPDFNEEDGKVSMMDLGERDIEGIPAHGERWTLLYEGQNGQIVQRTRIFETWTSAEMQLIIKVIEGDPKGEEDVWGLERISLTPDASLFQPPDGYEMTHRPYSDQ